MVSGGGIGGSGGRVGGPVVPPVPPPTEKTPESATGKKPTSAPVATDQFEKGVTASHREAASLGPLAKDASSGSDVFKLARDNPAEAKRMASVLSSQAASTHSEIERELAGARAVLEQLARERFERSARQKVAADLRRRRERIAALKRHYGMVTRKVALLQQGASQLGEPKLAARIHDIASRHEELEADWAKRHHLLGLGEALFDGDDATPEHLREVVQAEVRVNGQGEEVGNTLHEVSPKRVIAELMARTLDGSTRSRRTRSAEAARGRYGRALKSYSVLCDLVEQALERTALTKT